MSYSGPVDGLHPDGLHGPIPPVPVAPSPATKQDAAMSEHGAHHGHRHLHLDLSKRLHWPSFAGFHPGKTGHGTPSHHWPSIAYPSWPHFLAHSSPFHMTPLTPWVPPADVRQTPDCYLIEIDVPGLSAGDEEKVLVQWMSPRTVVVSAEMKKSAQPQLFNIPPAVSNIGSDIVNVSKSDGEDGGPLHRTQTHSSDGATATKQADADQTNDDELFLARERHDGYWRRSFTLPTEANFNPDLNSSGSSGVSLGYALNAGVLTIVIPRKKSAQK
ncbi:hypothetical protein DV735_g3779, partial [Chaetothyriales sp. CBS 134920]